jgi:hypothetical protein
MQILLSIAQELYERVYKQFSVDIENKGLKPPRDITKFWNIEYNNASLFRQAVGDFNPMYLRTKTQFLSKKEGEVRGKPIIVINDSSLNYLDAYVGYKGDIEEMFNAFLESINKEDCDFQKRFLNKKEIPKAEPREDIDDLIADGAKLMYKIHARHLIGQKFWFFFYGYDKFKGLYDENDTWPLVKLLLKFIEIPNSDSIIKVEIDNTDDPEHHDYVGQTDFFTFPRTEILVINCHTYPEYSRQLNIKVHIGSGDGDIFLGQYLNYESEGRIISGSVLMQKIVDENIDLEPRVYHVNKLKNNERYTEGIGDVDKNILQYMSNKKSNFRRTSLRAGHTLATLERWLNYHEIRNKKE